MLKQSTFHEGELAVQKRAKAVTSAKMNGLAISDKIPRGAMQFINQQPMLVIGSMDPQGKIWTSIIFGKPGFMQAESVYSISFDKTSIGLSNDDPLWANIMDNPQVGLLIIELGSRMRLRVNGHVQALSAEQFSIEVEQAYPNCPKYIQRRELSVSDEYIDTHTEAEKSGSILGASQQALINQSDTCFVASAHPDHGIDASHRGGQAGFVQIMNHRRLRVPDYAGNNLFNTLGNFQSYPFAGLVFIDFKQQRLLQLTGRVEILWDLDDTENASGGTQRFWEFDIESWRESQIPFAVSWKFWDASPFNPQTLMRPANEEMSLRVEKISQLTPRIKSFALCRVKKGDPEYKKLPDFEPGAHLPVKLDLQDGQHVMRHYSLLSDYRDNRRYEIAVLEEQQGQGGSLYLHNDLHEGDILQAKVPENDFPMVDKAKHSVLIAGGIGVTPIVSMLRRLSAEKQSFEMHYAARTHADFALLDTLTELAGNNLSCYTSEGLDVKRLDLQTVLATPKADTHVYVCGPKGMIEAVRDIAKANGWKPEQIHFESFGAKNKVEDKPISVFLGNAEKTVRVPANRSILDTLLAEGIEVPHQCKRGECGLCMTQVSSGKPEHRDLCLSEEQRKSSMCLCVSRASSDELSLEI